MKKHLLLVSLLVLCSCSNNVDSTKVDESSVVSNSSIDKSTNNAPFDVYIDVQDILNVDIHTDAQNNYFKGILTSATQYANGTKEMSKPKPTTISWFMEDYDVPAEYITTFEKFNVYLYNDDSLTKPRVFEVSDDLEVEVDNLYINHTHYYQVEAVFKDYSFKSEVKRLVTKDGIIRNLNVDGITNVRDLGNYKTDDNKRVKQGVLYRSGRFNTNNTKTAEITQKGIDTMVNEFNIQTEVDLRALAESGELSGSLLGSKVTYKRIDYSFYASTTFDDLYSEPNKSGAKNFFKLLADKDNLPLDFHCSIGTDRTGYLSFLVLAFLGVSEEECYRDYLFSNYGKIGDSRVKGQLADYLGKRLDEEVEGDTLKEKVTNYLLDIGLKNFELNYIRENLLEDL